MSDQFNQQLVNAPKLYWRRYMTAPLDGVTRPNEGEFKGYLIFDRRNNSDMDDIWVKVCWATREQHLGYYCGYSNDSQKIAIHFSEPSNNEKMETIRNNLLALGVKCIDFYVRPKEITAREVKAFDSLIKRGVIIKLEDYEREPHRYVIRPVF